jgi:hypothetical protein
MNVIFWIVFIGLCIKTGAILISFLITLFVNPGGAKNLYLGLDLFDLYSINKLYYVQTASFLIVLTGLKAFIAYFVVRFFLKFKLSKPFSTDLTDLFLKISYFSVGAGILAIIADGYNKWLLNKGIVVPITWGSEEIIFFAGVIYIFALIFKKGAELQAENDLTV